MSGCTFNTITGYTSSSSGSLLSILNQICFPTSAFTATGRLALRNLTNTPAPFDSYSPSTHKLCVSQWTVGDDFQCLEFRTNLFLNLLISTTSMCTVVPY